MLIVYTHSTRLFSTVNKLAMRARATSTFCGGLVLQPKVKFLSWLQLIHTSVGSSPRGESAPFLLLFCREMFPQPGAFLAANFNHLLEGGGQGQVLP
jgi:hypothetical protein